jgi:hypothetical protein
MFVSTLAEQHRQHVDSCRPFEDAFKLPPWNVTSTLHLEATDGPEQHIPRQRTITRSWKVCSMRNDTNRGVLPLFLLLLPEVRIAHNPSFAWGVV